jgi:hypothetical protein
MRERSFSQMLLLFGKLIRNWYGKVRSAGTVEKRIELLATYSFSLFFFLKNESERRTQSQKHYQR